ncbi:hypothetical protein CTEN210_00283 [Chaetoceros tenuissimus]|uniref:Peptide deformylase n=1 Tax=Chaetoceros tenuissimus TaxID=426638 RepID=A0AAD3CEV6_9STRA|nr:hypothetical protein CTEN210_00283 [Chaetoceros tenuissimus]
MSSSYALLCCLEMFLLVITVNSFQIANHHGRIFKQKITRLSATTRRKHLENISSIIFSSAASPLIASAKDSEINLENFSYNSQWTGTALKLLSPKQASELPNDVYDMGRWPDPILRRPATRSNINSLDVYSIAKKLRITARVNKAVGLAAQQCGIDFSIIFLDDAKYFKSPKRKMMDEGGLFLINPRIIDRSSEMDMKVWREECLVLPPSFRATVLRDAKVLVQYENLEGNTKEISLHGEQARCLQHELDHDRGILITDHVSLEDLENDVMRNIESTGHDERQLLAYSRFIDDPIDNGSGSKDLFLTKNEEGKFSDTFREWVVPPANAEGSDTSTNSSPTNFNTNSNTNQAPVVEECDEDCKQKRLERIKERRAMMQQSRSTGRAEVFELSKQRAALYGTTYQGASCPPGIPCI